MEKWAREQKADGKMNGTLKKDESRTKFLENKWKIMNKISYVQKTNNKSHINVIRLLPTK